MDFNHFFEIAMHAKQLCRELQPQSQYSIARRNETIVAELVKTYGISREVSRLIFVNNNDVEGLKRIYHQYYVASETELIIGNEMGQYVTEEIIYLVLNYYRDHPNAKASELGLDRKLFNNTMELIYDQGFAKGLNIKYGANGEVYAVLVHDLRLTLAGIRFLDDRIKEPMVYSVEDSDDKEITIFLSYSWDDSQVADVIETTLRKKGFIVRRDIRDIGPWKSIKEFMKSIRVKDYIVTLVSDKYLQSSNCMYEVGELLKDENYKNRLFPAIISHQIYDIEKRIAYVKYWEDKNKVLEAQINSLSLSNRASFTEGFRRSKEIEVNIGDFLNAIVDMNNPEVNDIGSMIVEEIDKRESQKSME